MLRGGFFYFNLDGVYAIAGLIKKLFVGASRCAGSRVSIFSWLMVLEMPNQPRVALARWMHRVCAEVAGWNAKSADFHVRLG